MHLINTRTLELKYFIDARNCPPYAILSHRWTDDEVTYKHFIKGRNKTSRGYQKIQEFCAVARQHDHAWAWVDTCCIDKSSSAELQEVINSMFDYYERSTMCYVHLADVTFTADHWDFQTQFVGSQWFVRGWTLQELLAPQKIVFFSQTWIPLGVLFREDKSRVDFFLLEDLKSLVSRASGIQLQYLAHRDVVFASSIACRMSWASGRKTTREEDMAYCLLGLFKVNMPLLYGEGISKAFLRLQEEIMKTSDDHSLFAWTASDDTPDRLKESHVQCRGLLAERPTFFSGAQNISPCRPRSWASMDAYALTSRGMKIVLHLCYYADNVYLARLDCIADSDHGCPTIILSKVSSSNGVFQRIFCAKASIPWSSRPLDGWRLETIIVQQDVTGYWSKLPVYNLRTPKDYTVYHLSTTTHTQEGHAEPLRPGARIYSREPLNTDLGSILPPESLSVEHRATSEVLIVTIAPISAMFIGFTARLVDSLHSTTPPWKEQADISMKKWTASPDHSIGVSPIQHPELYRLGTRISIPSSREEGWCHVVEIALLAITSGGGFKSYDLDLRLGFKMIASSRDEIKVGSRSGCVVVLPSGFKGEVGTRTWGNEG